MNTFKSCAICKHCFISLATPDYSELTPGEPPEFSCRKGHASKFDRYEHLTVACRNLGSQCPDFELMDEPE